MTTTTKPAHTIRFRDIEATIWPSNRPKGPAYNVTLLRTYKDASGAWQGSTGLSLWDLPIAAKLLDLAANWIVAQMAANGTETDAGE
jgi:hypothetical protein